MKYKVATNNKSIYANPKVNAKRHAVLRNYNKIIGLHSKQGVMFYGVVKNIHYSKVDLFDFELMKVVKIDLKHINKINAEGVTMEYSK